MWHGRGYLLLVKVGECKVVCVVWFLFLMLPEVRSDDHVGWRLPTVSPNFIPFPFYLKEKYDRLNWKNETFGFVGLISIPAFPGLDLKCACTSYPIIVNDANVSSFFRKVRPVSMEMWGNKNKDNLVFPFTTDFFFTGNVNNPQLCPL